jgi:CRP-like cAMP-binding protein
LAALRPEELAVLEPHLENVNLPRGKALFETGDTIPFTYFPHDSMIALATVLENGGTVEIAVYGREAVAGPISAFLSRKSFGRYVVQLPGTASRIPLERLHEAITTSRPINQLLRSFMEAFLAQTFQTLACNAVHGVEARCCRWVLSTHDRIDQDTLPLTHEFLSEMLGVQRSTVSTVLRTLQTAGLITQHRGLIVVTDRPGLERAVGECYRKIRQSFEDLLPGTYLRR